MTTDRQVLDSLLEVTALLTYDTARFAAAEQMTEARVHLLWELHRSGPTTQRHLADALGVTPRTITGLVDALVASDHVHRAPHPSDRRATLVTLTPAGRAFSDRLVAMHTMLAGQLVGDLDPALLEALQVGLAHVADRLHVLLQAQG